jgi:hypothetical protein
MTGRTAEVVGIMLTAIVATLTLGIVTGLISMIARGIRQERRYEEAARRVNGLDARHPPSTEAG